MGLQQQRIRRMVTGLENIKEMRLVSAQATRKRTSIRGKPAFSLKPKGPAHKPGYQLFELVTRDSKGISRWEVVARGDAADVEAALSRGLRR